MSPRLDKHDVVRCLQKQGKNLSSIARAAGFSDSICRLAFIRPQKTGETLIVEATGFKPYDLWPDRYDRAGNRKISSRKPSNNPCAVKRKIGDKSITHVNRDTNKRLGVAS